MCVTDGQNQTCYDLKPIKLRSSITDLEVAALRGVDIAERINEPFNRFDLARAGVRLMFYTARRLRRS